MNESTTIIAKTIKEDDVVKVVTNGITVIGTEDKFFELEENEIYEIKITKLRLE